VRPTGLSRGTVREALRLLASQNLVTTVRGVSGGSFVTQPSVSQLTDMLTTGLGLLMNTSVIDAPSCWRCARCWKCQRPAWPPNAAPATARDSGHIDVRPRRRRCGRDAAQAPAIPSRYRAASGNPVCELLSQPLYQAANEQDLDFPPPANFWTRVDVDHREIMRCITDRDADGARRAAAAHIAHVRDVYLQQRTELATGRRRT